MSGSPNRPYFLGLNESLNDLAAAVKKPGLRVDLVCDQQDEYAPHALNVFKWNKEYVKHLSSKRTTHSLDFSLFKQLPRRFSYLPRDLR